ncbi:phage tail-collar fiber domain-containing protein [Vibrio mangrovi]|uniref:Phage tail protein n=1 Tax=Vibrio mangrovi TaxID=474394 RepID=A0A1Y6ITQ2_9VIBR|nr:phage tail protein [Vibrio mangrovi]MDW6004723.1 phage tail protein [Vibrio mangrovi]SMS01014.1 hypothetical protein VIM7927_02291 [Vibrio mangrovi]
MSETVALVPVITNKGLAAVFNKGNDGLSARITHIALGDHGRVPQKTELGLVNERMRIAVADGQRIGEHQIHVTALADGGSEFWVREVGFILEDGTTLAIWSDTNPLAYHSANVPLLLAFDLALDALPAESVTIESTGANLSLAAWGEQYITNATASINNMSRHLKLMLRVMELEKNK